MKMTLAEIKSIEESLAKLFDKELNIKIAYKLSSLLKKLSGEVKLLEENRVKLVQKHGKKDEETQQVTVAPESAEAFYKEFSELMQIEVELDFEPIPLDAFGDITLSASDILKLEGKVISCPEEKPKKAKAKSKKKKTE